MTQPSPPPLLMPPSTRFGRNSHARSLTSTTTIVLEQILWLPFDARVLTSTYTGLEAMSAPHHSNSGTPLNLNAPIQLAEVLQSTQPQGILRNSESPLRTVTRSRYQAFFAQHRVHLKFFKSESEGWPRLWVATQIALPSLEFLKIAITSSPSVPFPRIASGWGCMKPSVSRPLTDSLAQNGGNYSYSATCSDHNLEPTILYSSRDSFRFMSETGPSSSLNVNEDFSTQACTQPPYQLQNCVHFRFKTLNWWFKFEAFTSSLYRTAARDHTTWRLCFESVRVTTSKLWLYSLRCSHFKRHVYNFGSTPLRLNSASTRSLELSLQPLHPPSFNRKLFNIIYPTSSTAVLVHRDAPGSLRGLTPSIILFFGIRGRSGISDNYYGNIEYTTYRVPASGLKCQEKTAGDQRGAAFQAMRRVLLAILGFSDEICSCERDRALEKKTARGKRPASLASRRIQPPAIGLVFCAPRSRRAAAAVTSTLNSNLRDPFSSLADQDSVQVKLKSKEYCILSALPLTAAPQLPLPPFWIRQRAPTAARISLRVDVARISNRRRGVLRLDAQDFQSKSTPRRVCMAAFRIRPALAPDLDPTGSRLVPHARDETPVGELRRCAHARILAPASAHQHDTARVRQPTTRKPVDLVSAPFKSRASPRSWTEVRAVGPDSARASPSDVRTRARGHTSARRSSMNAAGVPSHTRQVWREHACAGRRTSAQRWEGCGRVTGGGARVLPHAGVAALLGGFEALRLGCTRRVVCFLAREVGCILSRERAAEERAAHAQQTANAPMHLSGRLQVRRCVRGRRGAEGAECESACNGEVERGGQARRVRTRAGRESEWEGGAAEGR
ncbi:hypothetical protein C8R43DRAFT_959355 [Mycena crocata]|nr:hypothetical protein C8R43DRAFT_959355 [Mycena crocata]